MLCVGVRLFYNTFSQVSRSSHMSPWVGRVRTHQDVFLCPRGPERMMCWVKGPN